MKKKINIQVKDFSKPLKYKGSVAHTADILRNKKLGIFTDPADGELYIASYKGRDNNPKIDCVIVREQSSFTNSDMINNFSSSINHEGVCIHMCAVSWYHEGKYHLFKDKLKSASERFVKRFIIQCAEALGDIVKERNKKERERAETIKIEIKVSDQR